MWSDNDIDNAFQRLNPPEPDPTPFPLDAWLRLETELDKAVIERAVRRRLWKFFAAEVAVVLLAALGWVLWPTGTTRLAAKSSKSTAAENPATNNKLSRQSAAVQPAIASAAMPANAALRNTKSAATTSVPVASTEAAVETTGQKLAPHSTAAITTAPAAKHAPSTTAPRLSVASGVLPSRRRHNSTESRLADQSMTASQNVLRLNSRRGISQHVRTATQAATAEAAARQTIGRASTIVKNTDQYPAAGSLAAPTESPAEAVVADAASPSQLRRESQSPLLNPAVMLPAAPTNVASETGTPDAPASASATAIATLTPIASQFSVATPTGLPAPLALISEAPANLPLPVRQPRFYIGLVAAPDVTTVRFTSVERPMLNLGVMLEYRLTNRLRVNTGLLRSTKQYVAHREDYDFGAASTRVYQRDFSDVQGACTVLDVPLNLRYDIIARPAYRLFGSVGLSSFFMQRERYSYEYQENNTEKYWNGSAVNQNQHLLSILNLSAGYERNFSSHWSVQAEPYVKVPLAGVGLGKVRLTSAGVFFGVKYGF